MTTALKYLDDSEVYEDKGVVQKVTENDNGTVTVILDETIFYPQGGGQPTDRGEITTDTGRLQVTRVSFYDGEVLHSGMVASGELANGSTADLKIDAELRRLHAKLHTGGHLIMTAVDRLLKLPATKGYHFPDGPYVEFQGTVPVERRPAFVEEIQKILDGLVAENSDVTARFDTVENLKAAGVYMPAEVPEGKPTRVVVTSGYHSPCGGTHVKKLGELQGLRAKSIKVKSGKTRVSYYFDEETTDHR